MVKGDDFIVSTRCQLAADNVLEKLRYAIYTPYLLMGCTEKIKSLLYIFCENAQLQFSHENIRGVTVDDSRSPQPCAFVGAAPEMWLHWGWTANLLLRGGVCLEGADHRGCEGIYLPFWILPGFQDVSSPPGRDTSTTLYCLLFMD